MINISELQFASLAIFACVGIVCVLYLFILFIFQLLDLLKDNKKKVSCISEQEAKELKKKLIEMRREEIIH